MNIHSLYVQLTNIKYYLQFSYRCSLNYGQCFIYSSDLIDKTLGHTSCKLCLRNDSWIYLVSGPYLMWFWVWMPPIWTWSLWGEKNWIPNILLTKSTYASISVSAIITRSLSYGMSVRDLFSAAIQIPINQSTLSLWWPPIEVLGAPVLTL